MIWLVVSFVVGACWLAVLVVGVAALVESVEARGVRRRHVGRGWRAPATVRKVER